MTAPHYDVIVTGTGSMGSAACFYLARQGFSVLGLEQSETVPHEKGSHAGQSRIIRKAYFEHPGYVPLLEKAYENWHCLEELTGEKLFYKTGLLYSGPREHEVIAGVKHAASKYSIKLEKQGVAGVYPAFVSDDKELLFEPDAGFLLPEKAISLYIREAKKAGAVIHTGEKLLHWERSGGLIRVQTAKAKFTARKLIITAGAWAAETIRTLKVPLKVTRQLVFWVEPDDHRNYVPDQFPCWMLAGDDFSGVWYGFPYLSGKEFPGPSGLKFALHHAVEETDPDRVNREISNEEISNLLSEAKKHLPFASYRVAAAKTCLYTNSPDEHFIIDQLPGCEGDVVIACGFSGHGFKFASLVGEMVAGLAMKGTTGLPAGFLGLDRFE